MSLELVKDKETKETFTDAEAEYSAARLRVAGALYEAGLICRADDRGDPVIQLSPPLVATRDDLDFIHDVLDTVLDDAWIEMTKSGSRQTVSSLIHGYRRGRRRSRHHRPCDRRDAG